MSGEQEERPAERRRRRVVRREEQCHELVSKLHVRHRRAGGEERAEHSRIRRIGCFDRATDERVDELLTTTRATADRRRQPPQRRYEREQTEHYAGDGDL